ncbi:MAG: hypothetical protein JNL19_06005 [Burkholderiales bacterium]|nr:hypothetical protein [Burkholderiales bacterium]
MKFKGLLAALLVVASAGAGAQTVVNHPLSGGAVTYALGSGPGTTYYDYYDNGGSAGNYSNSANPTLSSVTFSAPTGQRVRVRFTSFQTETAWADRLYVYDGATTASPIIGSGVTTNGISACGPQGWEGSTAPNNAGPGVVESTGTSLTFTFCSDPSVTQAGWVARVELVGFSIGGTVDNPNNQGLVLSLNNGAQTVTPAVNGTFNFPLPLATGSTYAVTVQTQPPGAFCTVSNGTGVVGTASVSNILVSCVQSAVPTLSETLMIALSAMLALVGLGVFAARRRP